MSRKGDEVLYRWPARETKYCTEEHEGRLATALISRKGDKATDDAHYRPVQRRIVDGAGARSHVKPVVSREDGLL